MKPLSPEQIARLSRVATSTATSVAKAGWVIDYELLGEFCETEDIKYPVRIRYSSSWKGRKGTHRWYDGSHKITISQVWYLKSANRTLLHELGHARQMELFYRGLGHPPKDRWDTEFWEEYRCNKFLYEADADAFAARRIDNGVMLLKEVAK